MTRSHAMENSRAGYPAQRDISACMSKLNRENKGNCHADIRQNPNPLGLRSPPTFFDGGGMAGFTSKALGSFKLQEISSLCIAYAQSSLFLSF